MIVDTSAIMAILVDEPERQSFISRMVDAGRCALSAGSWIELAAVQVRGNRDYHATLDRLIERLGIVIEPVTAQQASLGHQAFRDYGLGSGHPARLNFGDCFAYALAKATGEPLLFKGDDFAHTDVIAAA